MAQSDGTLQHALRPIQQCFASRLLSLLLLCRLLSQAFPLPWHSTWTNSDPHRSDFKFQTAVPSVLRVTLQVQLSVVVNMLNVLLLWLTDVSSNFCHYSGGCNNNRYNNTLLLLSTFLTPQQFILFSQQYVSLTKHFIFTVLPKTFWLYGMC